MQASIDYLVGQLKAGADVLQIFDTWAGVLGPDQFERWCIAPTQKIVESVRRQFPNAKIIGFHAGRCDGFAIRGDDWRERNR